MDKTLLQTLLLCDEVLGSTGFYPLHPIARKALSFLPRGKQLAVYSKLMLGTDLSFLAPNELGCAESVSRIIESLFPGTLSKIEVSTTKLDAEFRSNKNFLPSDMPQDGTIIMASTGEGKGNGHVGIVVGSLVYSNNSNKGVWDKHLSVWYFTQHFKKLGFPIKYYKITSRS